MHYLKAIISSVLLVILIYLLSNPLNFGKTTLPPFGKLINPFSGFWANAEAIKSRDHQIISNKLSDNVTIIKDERHVPHIYAKNLKDLLFAQGYIIAQERLWQMDITTRSIEGTTSEVLGERSLNQDMASRRSGLHKAAQIAVDTWAENAEGMELINAFCNGINHYIKGLSSADYPLEFKLLDYKPQEWSPYRTALFIKAMAKTLNSRQVDIANSNALEVFGEETFNELYPEYNKKQSPIIQEKSWLKEYQSFQEGINEYIGKLIETKERIDHESFIGSNNFAISGEKTLSGNPILANDPHLKLSLPCIWLEMHLSCPELNAYGVSLPAMPGITLGFNDDIAWGQTNAGIDVLDIYQIKWVDGRKEEYILDGKKMKVEKIIEEFKVKDAGIQKDTILYTFWGPVKKEGNQHTDLAQHWISTQKPSPKEIEIYLNINMASDHNEFEEALKSFYTPAQNFIFGSKEGDIAMNIAGKLPIRKPQQGRFVQDGSVSSNIWKQFIPFDELPQELNPSRNFVASANQNSTDQSYPYYYTGGFEDYRGIYINSKLEDLSNARKEDLMNLQLDPHSLKAEEALPILLSHVSKSTLSTKEKEVLVALEKWDMNYSAESLAATYFEKWWNSFYDMTFDEVLAKREESNIPYPEAFRLIEMMEDDPENSFFDYIATEQNENLKDMINLSFQEVNFDSTQIKSWSEERNTEINHLTNIPAFRASKITSSGHGNTPNAISKYAGPSWRMVVELDDPIKAYGIYPGGQSGNPGSFYYDNFINDWAEGKYYELLYSRNPDDIAAYQTIKMSKE